MNDNLLVGKNLKMLRDASGYSQDELASVLGINRSTYANYESGIREMPYDLLEKASNLLGCETYLLFEENEEAKKQMLATAFRLDGLNESDLLEITKFQDLVKTYIKLDNKCHESRCC